MPKGRQLTQEEVQDRLCAYAGHDCDACAAAACTPPMTRMAFYGWREHRDPPLPRKGPCGKPRPPSDLQAVRSLAAQLGRDLAAERRRSAALLGAIDRIRRLAAEAIPAPIAPPAAVAVVHDSGQVLQAADADGIAQRQARAAVGAGLWSNRLPALDAQGHPIIALPKRIARPARGESE